MNETELRFEDIVEGGVYQFSKKITSDDVLKFANLTGDFNPLHVDKEFGDKSQFKGNIVHGMLAASLFSTLIGMYCPGKNSLYLSQTLSFKNPIYHEDTIIVRGTVVAKNISIEMVTLTTEILKDDKVCISGEAKIKVLKGSYE